MMSSYESVKFVRRRNNVVDDVMRKMNMFFKNMVLKLITIEFFCKEAIDDGGSLWELYTIFYGNAPGKLLYGPEKITRSCIMHTEMKSVIFIFSESLFRLVCCKEFQDRIAFVSHWLRISYQMILQLLHWLFHLLMFLFWNKGKSGGHLKCTIGGRVSIMFGRFRRAIRKSIQQISNKAKKEVTLDFEDLLFFLKGKSACQL